MTVPIDPTRLKTAASAVGTGRPQLATILAQSPLSGAQIQQVGGFAQAMTVNTVNNLAMDSGAQTNYTATQQDQLDGLGVKPANPKPQPADDSRSFLEKAGAFVANAVGNTGSFLLHNPVTGAIEDAGVWLGNATHLPFRMLSTALHGDGGEIDREMAADGYDPSKASSYVNFMFNEGENVYHDLSDVRGAYGDDDVNLAIQIQRDPQGWMDRLEHMPGDQAKPLNDHVNSDAFKQVYAAVDQNHVSPGRDLAGLLTLGHKDNGAYHFLSGVLDAAYDWYTDPTLILGKAHAALTALDAAGRTAEGAGIFQRGLQSVANNVEWLGNKRAGIEHMTDQVGVSALLRTDENGNAVTKVGKGWEQFLADAKQLRTFAAQAADKTLPAEEQAAAAAQRAGAWRGMVNRYGRTLMPLLDEVNGKAVLEAGEKGSVEGMAAGASGHLTTTGSPIETMDELRDYMVSKNGLLRLNNGMGAKRDLIMPGKLSLWAQGKAALGFDASAGASRAGKAATAKATWDYTDAGKMLPVAEEAGLTVGADGRITSAAADGDAQNALLTRSILTSVQAARAKADRLSRKFTSLIPSVDHVDLTDPNSGRIVEQIARTYLNKGDSARLASAYAVGDIAQRRAVLKGTLEQVFHASGLSKSEDGQAMMDKYLSDLDRGSDVTQKYGFDNSSVIKRGSDATPTQAALYPDQLSNKVLIPSFREMNYIAAKTAASGFARKTGLAGFNRLGQSDAMDHLLGTIKLGWIASAAGGMRNALDEVANFAVNGMGREVLAARSAFTQATRDLRAERRGYSQDYLAMLKDENGFTVSRKVVNQKIGEQVGAAHASVLDARAKLDQATRAQSKLTPLEGVERQAANDGGTVLYHGGLPEGATLKDIDLDRIGTQQGKGGKYGGFYLTDASSKQWSEEYAAQRNGNLHAFHIGGDAKIADLGGRNIDRLSAAERAKLAAEHDLVKGKDTRGRTQYVLLNKGAVRSVGDRGAAGKPLAFDDLHGMDPQALGSALGKVSDQDLATAIRGLGRDDRDHLLSGLGQERGKKVMDAFDAQPMLRRADVESAQARIAAKVEDALRPAEGPSPEVTAAQAGLAAAHKEFQRAVGLQTAIHYRVPYAFRKAADTMNDVFIGTALGKAMSVFGAKYAVTPERVKIAQELVNSELTQTLREGVFQSHYADSGAMLGSDDYAMALHHSGLQARKYSYQSVSKGWGEVEADGGTGLDAMAKTLQLRFADPKSPAHSWVQTILPMLGPDGQVTQEALDAATASVRARLEDPDLRHFLAQAEVFKHTRAGEAVGDSEALANQAKDEYAQRVSLDLVHALARRGSEDGTASAGINRGLLEQIFDGWHNETGPPDRSWLAQNLPTEERPATAIGQLWAPYNPAHAPGTTPRGYTQMMTAAYDKVVTDQINAISRNPLMTALYMNARENTKPYIKALQEAGWDEDSATEVAKQISLRQAQDQAFQHIDNPYVASQFAVVNRNFAAFWRAQEDWLRRWGRTVKDNPQVIRQAQLLIHGGQTAGLVEHDDQQNLTFVYPGSSLMLGLFSKAFGKLTGANPSQLPVAGELTSQLAFMNPSLDNPLGLTGTPLISLPFKAITALMGPQHAVLSSSLDQVVNGQLGANRQWWEQLLPSWASRILGGVLSTDPGSKYGAAFTGALANMEAAGQLDDPKYQTASGKAELMQNLQAAVHNQLAATALFGFSPLGVAAPTLDLEGTGGKSQVGAGNVADWSAHIAGLQSLKDEAREVFSKLPYDQALAWWQAVHPGELVYAQTGSTSRTQVGAKSANAPATTRAATWLEANSKFASAEKYGGKGGVASYFIPQGAPGSQDGSYNQVAYDAEMQAGIRQYKSLDDYFDDIVTAQGLREYYAAKDDYDAQKSSLTASGNKSGLQGLEAQWAAVKGDIEQRNPLVAAKLAAGAVDTASVATQIGQLTQMVQDTSPETVQALGANRAGVAALLQARAAYEEGTAALANRNSKSANTARQQLRDNYTAAVTAIAGTTTYGPHNQRTVTAGQFPELADLARGVFRLPN